jgi:hypothetical protein
LVENEYGWTKMKNNIIERPTSKVSVFHKFAHWLGLNSEFYDVYMREDEAYRCYRCNHCGKARNEIKLPKMLWDHLIEEDKEDFIGDRDTK